MTKECSPKIILLFPWVFAAFRVVQGFARMASAMLFEVDADLHVTNGFGVQDSWNPK
jgi:hypothetical protein